MNITVKYGIDQMPKHYASDSITIGDVVNDYDVRNQLGYGDNTRVLINGAEQPSSARVPDGATLLIETRANSKSVEVSEVHAVVTKLESAIDAAATLIDRLNAVRL